MNKKVILITGAGSGFGKAAAIRLAKRGHKVYATTQYYDEAITLTQIARKLKLDIVSFKLDILLKKDREYIKDLKVDVLINNAGINDSGSLLEINVDKIKKVYETNIFAMLELTQIVLKNMIKNKSGRIVFISSLYGVISQPFVSPYTSSKFAIEALAISLRKELDELKNIDKTINIDTTIIEPGSYYTGFNQEMILKQFRWMKEDSYFNGKIKYLKEKQINKLNSIEVKKLNSIISKYVKAVESKKCKKRYSAPKIQYIIAKIIQIFE